MEGMASHIPKARLIDAIRDNEKNGSSGARDMEGMASRTLKAGLIDANVVPTPSASSLRFRKPIMATPDGGPR